MCTQALVPLLIAVFTCLMLFFSMGELATLSKASWDVIGIKHGRSPPFVSKMELEQLIVSCSMPSNIEEHNGGTGRDAAFAARISFCVGPVFRPMDDDDWLNSRT